MSKNKPFQWILLAAGWMLLIFFLSHQPDLNTVPLLERLGILPKITNKQLANELEYVLRKSAHILEYAVLYILVFSTAASFTKNENEKQRAFTFLVSLLLCFAFAVTDEIHQSFVFRRSARIFDIIFDTFGIFWGQVLVLLYQTIKPEKIKNAP